MPRGAGALSRKIAISHCRFSLEREGRGTGAAYEAPLRDDNIVPPQPQFDEQFGADAVENDALERGAD